MTDKEIIKIFTQCNRRIASSKTSLNWLNKRLDIKNYLDNRFYCSNEYTYAEIIRAIINGQVLQTKKINITDEYIIELMFKKSDGSINVNYTRPKWLNNHKDIKYYLEHRFSDITEKEIKDYKLSYALIVWMIYYKMKNLPVCKICNRKIYRSFGLRNINITKYCSNECRDKDKELQIKSQEKRIKTINELNKKDPLRGKKIRDKREVTKAKLYPDDPHKGEFGSKKFKESMMNEYGSETYSQSFDYQMKKSIIEEKRYTTLMNRYDKGSLMEVEKFYNKRCETINKNLEKDPNYYHHRFIDSKPELKCYEYLCNKFGKEDIKRQYKDKGRYPFRCDFYIKSLDLFIECNYYWAHQDHIFNPSDIKDIEKLKEYKEKVKTKSGYNEVIKTWSLSDPNKVNTAKNNNLNYIILWKSKNDDIIFDELKAKIDRFKKGENFIID